MRNTFSEALYEAATKNPDIYIVVSDISPAGSIIRNLEIDGKERPLTFHPAFGAT